MEASSSSARLKEDAPHREFRWMMAEMVCSDDDCAEPVDDDRAEPVDDDLVGPRWMMTSPNCYCSARKAPGNG